MAEISPLAGLPAGGVFPLDFSPAFLSAVGAKGGAKRDEAIGLKCKPFISYKWHRIESELISRRLQTSFHHTRYRWTARDEQRQLIAT
jgi:hypothetical protein